MVHLIWATLVLGVRAGVWVAGFILGTGVALVSRGGRLLLQEGVRIYTRHHLEATRMVGVLRWALVALVVNLAVGIGILSWVSFLHGLGIIVVSISQWVIQIEYYDIRASHSTTLEDYLLPWTH